MSKNTRKKRGMKSFFSNAQKQKIDRYILAGKSLTDDELANFLEGILGVKPTREMVRTVRGYGAWLYGRQDTRVRNKNAMGKALSQAANELFVEEWKRREAQKPLSREEIDKAVDKSIAKHKANEQGDKISLDAEGAKLEDISVSYKGLLVSLLPLDTISDADDAVLRKATTGGTSIPYAGEVVTHILSGIEEPLGRNLLHDTVKKQFKIPTLRADIILDTIIEDVVDEYMQSEKYKKPTFWNKLKHALGY